jgi:SAM-dependent methyltransferase
MSCRHCGAGLRLPLVDLGAAPPSNSYLSEAALHRAEKWYPLRVLVCESCWLVQTEDFAQADELFDADYAYFSGYSSSWLAHCEDYAGAMTARFNLDANSRVIEVAANDGSLLQYFLQRGFECIGIEPTASTAAAARARKIDVIEQFFGTALARELHDAGKQADLMIANNVLAHVPDINDFVAGFALALKPAGVVTFEFPHLLSLLAHTQFDTIYHEHFSYLSLTVVNAIAGNNGLRIFDVEKLVTHGGSLRVFAERADTQRRAQSARLTDALQAESAAGIASTACYAGFQTKAEKIKNDLLTFLIDAKRAGRKVAAYGAAAKGNTLLNFAGVRADLVAFVVDRNPAKQGKFLPGSRIPIADESELRRVRPDYVLILPWNIRDEITAQLEYVTQWGGRFVTAVPALSVFDHAAH